MAATQRLAQQHVEVTIDEAVASHLEQVSVLCLQLTSGAKLSAFLSAVSRAAALWREYLDDEEYRQHTLRAEALLDDE